MATSSKELAALIRGATEDLIFLRNGRDAVLSHPFVDLSKESADAAMCRLVAVMVVATVDKVLEAWKGEAFLAGINAAGVTNGARVRALGDCFRATGVLVDDDVLTDYIAVKALRNGLVHLGWREAEKQFIQERGFTVRVANLKQPHWMRMLDVTQHLLGYLSAAALSSDWLTNRSMEESPAQFEGFDQVRWASQEDKAAGMFVRPATLPRLWWKNLEKVADQLPTVRLLDDGTVNVGPQRGQTPDEIRTLGDVALESWQAFRAGHPKMSRVTREDALSATRTFADLTAAGIHPLGALGPPIKLLAADLTAQPRELVWVPESLRPRVMRALTAARDLSDHRQQMWDLSLADGMIADLLPLFVPRLDADRLDAVAHALWHGGRLYRGVPNSTPLNLFTVTLPALDPERAELYKMAATEFAELFTLRLRWSDWVESTERAVNAAREVVEGSSPIAAAEG